MSSFEVAIVIIIILVVIIFAVYLIAHHRRKSRTDNIIYGRVPLNESFDGSVYNSAVQGEREQTSFHGKNSVAPFQAKNESVRSTTSSVYRTDAYAETDIDQANGGRQEKDAVYDVATIDLLPGVHLIASSNLTLDYIIFAPNNSSKKVHVCAGVCVGASDTL